MMYLLNLACVFKGWVLPGPCSAATHPASQLEASELQLARFLPKCNMKAYFIRDNPYISACACPVLPSHASNDLTPCVTRSFCPARSHSRLYMRLHHCNSMVSYIVHSCFIPRAACMLKATTTDTHLPPRSISSRMRTWMLCSRRRNERG
jgi:hypothetical protein